MKMPIRINNLINFNKVYLTRVVVNYVFVLLILILTWSCKSSKIEFVSNNFDYNVMLFNKQLEISSRFFGDMQIIDSKLADRK